MERRKREGDGEGGKHGLEGEAAGDEISHKPDSLSINKSISTDFNI